MNLGDLEFKPEDLDDCGPGCTHDVYEGCPGPEISRRANDILREKLAKAREVFGDMNRIWQTELSKETHNNGVDLYPQKYRARPVAIEEIEK